LVGLAVSAAGDRVRRLIARFGGLERSFGVTVFIVWSRDRRAWWFGSTRVSRTGPAIRRFLASTFPG
jgi:hypothetical protein